MRSHVTLAIALLVLHSGLAGAQASGAGLDRSGFDPAVRPQDDLFKAVNGQWVKDTPIPADKSNYGTFILLRDRSDERVRKVIEELAAAPAATGSNEQKVGSYYRSFMDEAAIDGADLSPLLPWLAQIDGLKNKAALAGLMGQWQGQVAVPLTARVTPDRKQPGIYSVTVWQSGLGLPDRSYYVEDGERFAKARAAYLGYAETLLRLSGDAHAARSAQTVFALEKRLAAVQWAPVDNRNPVKTYNPTTPTELKRADPGLAWDRFFAAATLPPMERLSVGQPSYAKAMARLVRELPLADWKLYLRVRLLDAAAPVLPQPFREAHFAFNGRAIQGSEAALATGDGCTRCRTW
jgi:putative endopeptidase